MAQFREREEDENDGVPVDLKQKVCPTCRRKLEPWETTCPDDGSVPVAGVQMGSVEDQILSRLPAELLVDLDDENEDDDDHSEGITVQAEPPPDDLPEPRGGRDLPKWAG